MARKNGNGEGSRPRKRADGRWEARYWSGGSRRSVYGKNRKEVAERLVEAIAAGEVTPAFVPASVTLGEFLVQYEDAVKYTMKRRSFETYLDIARLHLLPAFADTKLEDLTRERVQRMYARKRDEGLRPRGYVGYTACSPPPSTTRCVGGWSNTTCARRSARRGCRPRRSGP